MAIALLSKDLKTGIAISANRTQDEIYAVLLFTNVLQAGCR